MRAFLLLLWPLLFGPDPTDATFRQGQQRYPRVRTAYAARWSTLQAELQRRHLAADQLELYLRAFKIGQRVEVWARNRGQGRYQLLRRYAIAATSGKLGPKLRSGDGQVPEGCYRIDRYNPNSLYHLSLGLDYPNAFDRARGEQDPGGDIFIHGSNVTIGCLPITDTCIEELYVLAVEARAAGQADIPVHIFPFELNATDLEARWHSPHHAFWQTLAPVYRYFEQHHTLPPTDAAGAYVVR
ncbi:L,D-transpeptidase family protein [Hymenobacter edaphi]|uniref:L,D-transpeptidase family protein n=1 Tax=Hymenobacter edaphi TaxID=2211146 RepID=UPI001A9F765B|nr:L,D-transpeptidase family protein [Hymenobacter edaphi]